MNTGTSANSTTVLTSWKDIARYMGKGVRTVQRWEQDFGLPVRRPHGSNKKAILARPCDLDAWVALRCASRADRSSSADFSDPKDRAASVAFLSSLQAQMHTAQMLRDNNLALIREMRMAVEQLRDQLESMQQRGV